MTVALVLPRAGPAPLLGLRPRAQSPAERRSGAGPACPGSGNGHGSRMAGAGLPGTGRAAGRGAGAVPSARLHTRHILWEWALTPLSENAEQVVPELTANAVAAARAMPQIPPVRLWLLTDKAQVLILVWGASPCQPAAAGLNPGRRLCRERPGPVPGRDVQRPVGVIPHAADGRQGRLGALRHEP